MLYDEIIHMHSGSHEPPHSTDSTSTHRASHSTASGHFIPLPLSYTEEDGITAGETKTVDQDFASQADDLKHGRSEKYSLGWMMFASITNPIVRINLAGCRWNLRLRIIDETQKEFVVSILFCLWLVNLFWPESKNLWLESEF